MGEKRSTVLKIFERFQKAKDKIGKERRANILKENLIALINELQPENIEIYGALKVYGNDFLKFVIKEISEEKAWEIKKAFSP